MKSKILSIFLLLFCVISNVKADKITADLSKITTQGSALYDNESHTVTFNQAWSCAVTTGKDFNGISVDEITNFTIISSSAVGGYRLDVFFTDGTSTTGSEASGTKFTDASPASDNLKQTFDLKTILASHSGKKIDYFRLNTPGDASAESLKTRTFSEISLEYEKATVITCFDGAEVTFDKLTWHAMSDDAYIVPTSGQTWLQPSYRINEDTGSAYYGADNNIQSLPGYVDLDGYASIRIYQDGNSNVPRVFFFDNAGTTTAQLPNEKIEWKSSGYFEIDLDYVLSTYDNLKLVSLRPAQYSTSRITRLVCVEKNKKIDYCLFGSGTQNADVANALADANAKVIDATGLTGTGINLVSANPNCIFIADAGVLSNTENVMIGSTIANLALTDGKPFSVPAGATATTASYDRTFSAAYSTVCLPFAATFTGTAYEFGGNDGTTVTFTPVSGTTLEAGKAYLVSNDFAVTGGSGALAAPASSAFKGTYTAMTVPAGTYGFSGGEFKKVGANVTCKPFRAYLDLTSSAKALNVSFGETAINNIVDDLNNAENIYGVNGARQDGLQKGINIIKLSNGATRKVVIK